MSATEVHVLRVFANGEGRFGNPLGVLLDAKAMSDAERQAIAARLGFSETVFVDDVERAGLRIFTPATELRLAGHPLVGTAWLLSQMTGHAIETLRPALAAPVITWQDGVHSWIRARVADAPSIEFVQLASPAEVEALKAPPGPGYDHHEFWAWIDEPAGILRARFFAPALGIMEDEATGSAALRLADRLGRPLTIRQGAGSVIHARPAADGYAEVGGRVVRDPSLMLER